jgi:hypothetical protein
MKFSAKIRKTKLAIWMKTDPSGTTVTPPPDSPEDASAWLLSRMRMKVEKIAAAPDILQRVPGCPIESTSTLQIMELTCLIVTQGEI